MGVSQTPNDSGVSQEVPDRIRVVPQAMNVSTCGFLAGCGDLLRDAGLLSPFGRASYTCPVQKLFDLMSRDQSQLGTAIDGYFPEIAKSGLRLETAIYARLEIGGGHVLHADSVKLDGTPNHTPNRRLAVILYLRSCGYDFQGGELVLPFQQLTIKPEVGMMVMIPSSLGCQHQVNLVRCGVRDSIAVWFK